MTNVSIILPYYNAENYICETVDSIIAQTYRDWELIIVDDCSTAPETHNVLNVILNRDRRIRIVHSEINGGAGLARNLGINKAAGRFIAFCDSDDWWYPTKLEEQIGWMEENGYEFTCTWYEDTYENLEPYYTMKQVPKQSYKNMMSGCNIGTPGVIYDTSRIGKKFMPDLRRAEDWGLWMIILREVDYIYTYPKVLWKYRHISGSESSNKWKMLKAVLAMYTMVLGFSNFKAFMMCFFVFLPKNIWKKLCKPLK